MNKSLIFDIDGTLWDAIEASTYGFNQALNLIKSPKKIQESDIRSMTGQPWSEIYDKVFKSEESLADNFHEIINREEAKSIRKFGGQFYPKVREVLTKLSKKYDLYLISNCQDWYLKVFLEKINLNIFKDTDCFGNNGHAKFIMIQNMIKKHQLKGTIYIGDTQGDYDACKKSNCNFIHAKYGFCKDLKNVKSIVSLEKLLEIL